jgi:hypothetical protein
MKGVFHCPVFHKILDWLSWIGCMQSYWLGHKHIYLMGWWKMVSRMCTTNVAMGILCVEICVNKNNIIMKNHIDILPSSFILFKSQVIYNHKIANIM